MSRGDSAQDRALPTCGAGNSQQNQLSAPTSCPLLPQQHCAETHKAEPLWAVLVTKQNPGSSGGQGSTLRSTQASEATSSQHSLFLCGAQGCRSRSQWAKHCPASMPAACEHGPTLPPKGHICLQMSHLCFRGGLSPSSPSPGSQPAQQHKVLFLLQTVSSASVAWRQLAPGTWEPFSACVMD